MAVYFIANIRITDEAVYAKYLERSDEIFARYNGDYLAVDNAPEVLEGQWNYTRSVLIRFPDKTSFNDWYRSLEYQEILRHRLEGAECDTIVIAGNE